jgi:hypothetical protein
VADWRDRQAWAWDFEPACADIIAGVFGRVEVRRAPLKLDRERGTDLVTIDLADLGTFATRVRAAKYQLSFPHDITLRLSYPSGARTEVAKLAEGEFATWYLYGFCGLPVDATRIVRWTLLKCAAMQGAVRDIVSRVATGQVSGHGWNVPPGNLNHHGGECFLALRLPFWPADWVHASSHPIPRPTDCAWCHQPRTGPAPPACTCARCGRGHVEVQHAQWPGGDRVCLTCYLKGAQT